MVRAHMKQPSEEKKDSPKKKTPPKKKSALTGIWPCKINGCNKQFAREADLKRHQRTTKLHSLPGFACPQCDATFTRTDALRRHQKSRHNGVIIEPAGTEKTKDAEDAEARSSGSKSSSRSGTPSAKGKEVSGPQTPAALAQPGTAGPPSGASSYYRFHTASSTAAYMPSRPPPVAAPDAQYPPGMSVPSSATRVHPSWPPQWGADGQVPPISQIPHLAYHQVAGPHAIYYPASYYRPNNTILPPQVQSPHQSQINPDLVQSQEYQNGTTSSQSQSASSATHDGSSPHSVVVDPRLSELDSSPIQRTMKVDGSHSISETSVIDPSLDCPSVRPAAEDPSDDSIQIGLNGADSEPITSLSFKITRAAMEAVFKSVRSESNLVKASPARNSRSPIQLNIDDLHGDSIQPSDLDVHRQSDADGDADADGEADVDIDDESIVAARLTPDQGYHTPLHLSRPEPMDHILTEDGEPMLNPAELLTQESLASPPPS